MTSRTISLLCDNYPYDIILTVIKDSNHESFEKERNIHKAVLAALRQVALFRALLRHPSRFLELKDF
jgi:hypothetical protein